MTPVPVRGIHGVARDAEAVLVVETLTGDGAFAFRIPPGEAARVARVLGLGGCRGCPSTTSSALWQRASAGVCLARCWRRGPAGFWAGSGDPDGSGRG